MIWILFFGFLGLGLFVQWRLKSKFRRYSEVPLRSGLSGAEIAENMLAAHGIRNVQVTCVAGELTDHCDPSNLTVNLSEEVFFGRNAAAAAVAAHECGHAVQHATAYSFLTMRTAMVPLQNVSAKVLNVIFILGFLGVMASIVPYKIVMITVIGAYAIMAVFSLITLPVEFDASARALAWIKNSRIVSPDELAMSKDALHWAAMTYVVSALSSVTYLLYYAMSFMGNDD